MVGIGEGRREYIRRMVVSVCSLLYEDNRIQRSKRQCTIKYDRKQSYFVVYDTKIYDRKSGVR